MKKTKQGNKIKQERNNKGEIIEKEGMKTNEKNK